MITKILIAIILIFSCFSITALFDLLGKGMNDRSFKGLTGEFQFFLLCFCITVYFSVIYFFN